MLLPNDFDGWNDVNKSSFDESSDDGGSSINLNRMPKKPTQNDRWLGQKLFGCFLAESLLRHGNHDESAFELDSKLAAALLVYPYSRCWDYLLSHGIDQIPTLSTTTDIAGRSILLSWIGFITRQGSIPEKSLLRYAMRKFMPSTAPEAAPRAQDLPTNGIFETEQPDDSETDGQHNNFVSARQPDDSAYTMKLKEYGDHNRELPIYTLRTVSLDPPLFKCQVKFQNIVAQGVGKTKKEAKHKASKEACLRLGVQMD